MYFSRSFCYINLMRYLCSLLLFLFITGCATSPTGRNQFMLISPEQAIVASNKAYAQAIQPLDKKGKVDSNPVVAARVREITGRIIYQAIQLYPHTEAWEWSIKVLDDQETVNAWCMAGGKMAIYTGLLNKVKPSDDELAQVLAHEISHALANHTAERMSVAMATQLGILGVGIASRDQNHRGAILTGSAMAAMLAIQLPNSRSSETEADVMGLELAALAGYNPYAAASLWDKMEKVGGSGPPQFLSSHPSPGNRQEKLLSLAPRYMEIYEEPRNRPVYQLKP